MRRLLLVMVLLFQFPAVVVAATTVSLTPANLKAVVMTQAALYDIPPLLLAEVCKKESGLKWEARGLDDAARRKPLSKRTEDDYSYGVCQVKIGTARWVWSKLVPKHLRREVHTWNLYDPYFNAGTAAIYMGWLYDRYDDWKLALVAYNRGHNRRPGEAFHQHVRRLRRFTRHKPRNDNGDLQSPHYTVVIYQHWVQVQMAAGLKGVIGVSQLYELHERILYGKIREPFYWTSNYLTFAR